MNSRVAHANPTRRFFVDILTRDISLTWAILDLIDNSIDSFRSAGESFEGSFIELKLGADGFEIKDNARGISVENAEDYAFSFGRKDEAKSSSGAIGLYGVGMKRSIFKIGRKFLLKSTTSTSSFNMDVDVNVWLAGPEPEWAFPMEEVVVDSNFSETGTELTISQLTPGSSSEFQSQKFVQDLRDAASKIYCLMIEGGLKIRINGNELPQIMPKISFSAELEPKVVILERGGIKMKLIAGLHISDSGNQDTRESGWTVFCNDRAVLIGDKSEITGWGQSDDLRNPKYHNQYSQFRGFVWISADDSLLLPWNTTKTSLDVNNAFYQAELFPQMQQALRAVADYLNELKVQRDAYEQSAEDSPPPLAVILEHTDTTSNFDRFTFSQPFRAEPTLPVSPKPKMVNVQFKKEKQLVQRVADHYDSELSASKLGEALFDDYVSKHGLDHE